MGDALSGIKTTHGFDRLTKAAEGEFWEVKAVKGDKKKTLDIKADFEGKEQDEQAADPEVEAKAQEGFAELRQKAAKFDGDGASKEEADKIVRDVKAKHPVFTKLSVVDGEEDWDFEATYNPTVKKDGPDKKEPVIGQMPQVGLYKDLKKMSYIDPESGRKIKLIGHHVAEYKLAAILKSFYGTVSSRVENIEGLKEFADKAKARTEIIGGYAKGHGANLSVVLLSEEAHKGDVHGASQAENHLSKIEQDLPKDEVRVVLVKKSDQKKVVSIHKEKWEAFLGAYLVIESDLEKTAGENFITMEEPSDENGNKTIRVNDVKSGADSSILDKAIELYSTLMSENEGKDVNIEGIINTVNNSTKSAVNGAIANGVSTVASALGNSKTDGEDPTKIIPQLKTYANAIWSKLVKKI